MPGKEKFRVAVIGGGISGLSAAYHLSKARKAGAPVEAFLFEARPRLGGSLRTETLEGCLIEAGADSFLSEKTEGREFCKELGLGGRLIGSNDDARRTWILVGGELIPLPDGLEFIIPAKILPFAFTRLLGWADKFKILAEVFRRNPPPEGDESVAEFVERHFGRELLEVLVDPMLNGVYGADTRQLSVRAVLPRLVAMERERGSLLLGMLAARRRRLSAQKAGEKLPLFSALQGGFTELVAAVEGKLDSERVFTGCPVQAIEKIENAGNAETGYRLRFEGREPMDFNAVRCAQPAWAAADLAVGLDAPLAGLLRGIPYASSLIVALVYDRAEIGTLPEGFGFLVPRREGKRLRACTFVGQKFDHRVPDDRVMLRCFLGGMADEEILSLDDDQVSELVRGELRDILGVSVAPLGIQIFRWWRAMAQYPVGHLERLEAMEARLRGLPGLFLAGNGHRGIGVPDCIRSGREAAEACLSAAADRPRGSA